MMMNPVPSLVPLGFRFDPSDEELLSYLIRRATGLPLLPSGANHQHIVERQLYGDTANPWHVFHGVSDVHWDIISELGDDDEDRKEKRVIYVVTKLTKISKGKTRIARRAGCGTWSGQTPPRKIYNESTGQWVGTMRMLSFERAKGEQHHDPRDQHHWIMHEYSLDGIYNNNNNNNNNSNKVDKEYVICRITRVFKGKSQYSTAQVPCGDTETTRNNIDTSAQQLIHEEEDDVVHACPNKKRKREINIITQQVDQGRRRRYSPRFGQLEHHHDVSSSAGEEKELGGESSLLVSMPAAEMTQHLHDEASNQQLVESLQAGEEDPDFDRWMSSLDNVLVELPEDQNSYSSSDDHNNTTIAGGLMSLADQQEDHTIIHTQAATSNQLDLVESVSVLETTAQQADNVDQYDQASSSTILAADWMTFLDDVELPEDDEDQNSNHNNWTTAACFNLDHLDLIQELCY